MYRSRNDAVKEWRERGRVEEWTNGGEESGEWRVEESGG